MQVRIISALGIILMSSPIHANYPALVGDVIGRSLNYKGGGWLGHTGLATAEYYLATPNLVMEAMDTVPHIRQNTVKNFKTESTYWGSRGGLIKLASKDHYTVANRVVRQYYACPDYSYTWVWKAGTITDQAKPITCALFRCDTLINHAYQFGTHHLPTYDTRWTTPIGVWNSFFIDTDLFSPLQRSEHRDPQPTTNETVDSITESNLKELKSELFYEMLRNSEDITIEQINRLWNLFESNDVDEQVKILFYNFIVSQDVSHLSDDVIKRAKSEKGIARHQLLLVLQTIYQTKLAKNDKAGLEPIIKYFEELQLQKLNKDDAGIVYRAMAALAPDDIREGKQNLITMDKIHVAVFRLKSDHGNDLKYVKDIIDNLKHPDDGLVVTASYKYLTELLISSDLKLLSARAKELFKQYLAQKKMIDTTQGMLYTAAYIEFKAALNAKTVDDIPGLTTQYMQGFDADRKGVTPLGFSAFTQKKLGIEVSE